jgi:anti-sigma factor RsiW
MTMDCREVRHLAEAFVSEQLLVETTGAIVAHLETCAPCRAEIAGLQRLRVAARSAITSAPGLAPRPEFIASLNARLRAEGGRPSSLKWRGWLVMAAAVLLVTTLGVVLRDWSMANFAGVLHAAVGDHRYCALDFKLAEKPITFEEAARRFGDIYERLQDVAPPPAALSGGPLRLLERHSCIYQGHRFAHIVFEYRGEAVSLLITGDRGISNLASTLPAIDGFHTAGFREAGYVAFLVSSLSDDDVREVAAAMSDPVVRALRGA